MAKPTALAIVAFAVANPVGPDQIVPVWSPLPDVIHLMSLVERFVPDTALAYVARASVRTLKNRGTLESFAKSVR